MDAGNGEGTWFISEILLEDDFEAGLVDTDVWCFADMYGNVYNYGTLPEVIYDGAERGYVLHVENPGSNRRQRLGAIIETGVLNESGAVVASMLVRRETEDTVFSIQTRKFTNITSYNIGCPTQITETKVWSLPKVSYWPGIHNDYLYPSSGFWIRIPNSLHCCGNDDYYVEGVVLEVGTWYKLELVFTKTSFSLVLDGECIFQQANPYYDFDRTDDWLFMVGDGDSEWFAPCDLSVDDVMVGIDPGTIAVAVDVKPGSFPNSINLKSRGVLPVAVLSENDFLAASIDYATVALAGAAPVHSALEDANGDGIDDLVMHFKVSDLGLDSESTGVVLTGETLYGRPIRGTDSVRIVPPRK